MEENLRSVNELYEKAEEIAKKGERQNAIGLYTKIIDLDTANCLIKDEDDLIIEKPEKLALTFNNRGYLHYLNVDFPEAVEDYTNGIKHNERLPVLYYNRGLVHFRLGRYDEAERDLRQCLTLDKTFPDVTECLELILKSKKS